MKFLSDEQLADLSPAETESFASPVPTQIVSSDEYLPVPQTDKQRQVELRLKELSDRLARRQGLSRRRFFETAAGMAASFVALNEVFGHLFDASPAEAATPEMANERANALSGQFIIDGHTHFLRDDTRLVGFVKMRNAFGKLGWNKELTGDQTLADLERVRMLFDDLEQKEQLIGLLDLVRDAEGVRIFIGAETRLFSLSGSAVIAAPYMSGRQKVLGAIGVIGPTRLNYARIIPMVDHTAKIVGKLLA